MSASVPRQVKLLRQLMRDVMRRAPLNIVIGAACTQRGEVLNDNPRGFDIYRSAARREWNRRVLHNATPRPEDA